jgi:hypothetical protein
MGMLYHHCSLSSFYKENESLMIKVKGKGKGHPTTGHESPEEE